MLYETECSQEALPFNGDLKAIYVHVHSNDPLREHKV